MLPSLIDAQWEYRSEHHLGWGTYKYSTAIGESDNSECPTPNIIINRHEDKDELRFYFTNLCRICEGVYIQLKFDNEYTTYMNDYECYYNNFRHELVMPDCFTTLVGEKLSKDFFLQKMKGHKVLKVRIADQCDTTTLVFSMEGYNKALRYVLSK